MRGTRRGFQLCCSLCQNDFSQISVRLPPAEFWSLRPSIYIYLKVNFSFFYILSSLLLYFSPWHMSPSDILLAGFVYCLLVGRLHKDRIFLMFTQLYNHHLDSRTVTGPELEFNKYLLNKWIPGMWAEAWKWKRTSVWENDGNLIWLKCRLYALKK